MPAKPDGLTYMRRDAAGERQQHEERREVAEHRPVARDIRDVDPEQGRRSHPSGPHQEGADRDPRQRLARGRRHREVQAVVKARRDDRDLLDVALQYRRRLRRGDLGDGVGRGLAAAGERHLAEGRLPAGLVRHPGEDQRLGGAPAERESEAQARAEGVIELARGREARDELEAATGDRLFYVGAPLFPGQDAGLMTAQWVGLLSIRWAMVAGFAVLGLLAAAGDLAAQGRPPSQRPPCRLLPCLRLPWPSGNRPPSSIAGWGTIR